MSLYRIRHFRPGEFQCRCCGKGFISRRLVLRLDLIRRAWGGPILINSGYRCARRNAGVGGAAGSRHLIGCAADITCTENQDKLRFENFVALVSRMCETGKEGWEVVIYPQKRFIHVAVPREEASQLWEGGEISV
ncbi:MAG: peptidase M15 [Synergistaceae bacterium]|nr:peptidase M15 [Synergistaceae bacterium]